MRPELSAPIAAAGRSIGYIEIEIAREQNGVFELYLLASSRPRQAEAAQLIIASALQMQL